MRSQCMVRLTTAICLLSPAATLADTVTLASGDSIQGIITKLENGQVRMQVGTETKALKLGEINAIDFDTPHLTQGTEKLPLDHFLKDLDAQEMVRLGRDMKKILEDLREQLDQIRMSWPAHQAIAQDQMRRWEASKESFQASLYHYKELVNDMYFHVLAQVDEYNKLVREAEEVYVGVKGAFHVGSALVPPGLHQMQAQEIVPNKWYDKIYYEAYRRGYNEGLDFERLSRIPQACETTR
jgi:hypothetical protein